MLRSLGKIVTSKPWFMVIFIIIITFGFSLFLPALEMQTSMEDFLPDDEVVLADERINEYFGASDHVIMVLVEQDQASSVVDVSSLEEMYHVSKQLTDIDYVEDAMSIAGFIDIVCGIEYNKSLDECSKEQIQAAYYDLMTEPTKDPTRMNTVDDPNEDIDIQRSRFSRKSSVDTMDVKNLEIMQNDSHITFSILLYDSADIESMLMSSGLRLNVMEWFVEFSNTIGPEELQDMKYTIAAHIEPKEELWDIGGGILGNINHLLSLIRERELRRAFSMDTILWMQPPGEEMAFPIPLETGNISWDTNQDSISISVSREELGDYGIAFENSHFGMPAKLGNMVTGVRTYQLPFLQLPWLRVTYNMSFIQNRIEKMQTRTLLGPIAERMLSKYGDMSWDDINEMMSMMDSEMSSMDSLSLTQMQQLWRVTDQAPDNGVMSGIVFLKPSFLTGMKDSTVNFLSTEFEVNSGASAALIMVSINGSLNYSMLDEVSRNVVDELSRVDSSYDAVSFSATGNSIIEYEINDVSMEANGIIIPLMFVVICLILFISFRKVSYVVLPMLGLTFAIIWTFGSMVVLGMPFMVMEVALIPMLMGLGVDYSVHLYHNYRVERGRGKNPRDAMDRSIQDIGMAMLLATITTFIAFLSFLTATMIPMRDFGVLCAVGIAYVFAVTLTFQASLRFIIDQRKNNNSKKVVKESKKEYGGMMRRIAGVVCKHPVPIIILTILISFVMMYGSSQLETGFAMEDFLPEENPSVQVLNTIMDEFPFASTEKEYVLVEGDKVASVSTLEGLSDTIDNLKDNSFVMMLRDKSPKTESILTVIQSAMEHNDSFVQRFSLDSSGIPSSDANVVSLFDYLYDDENLGFETQMYLHRNDQGSYDATVLHVYTDYNGNNGADSSNMMEELYNELLSDVDGVYPDVTATVTGDNSMMHVIMSSMTESQLASTMICLVLAAIVLVVAYRNPVLGLIAMIPVSISTLWILGTMYFIGYTLNVMTIMITSLTIGLGITYAIHAVERFRLVAEHTGDVISAVTETIGHTGGALLISAVTTILGFGLLVLVPMPVEQQFGLITAITIAYAFLTSIFILPPVLLFWGKWRKKHKGYVISPGDPNDRKQK